MDTSSDRVEKDLRPNSITGFVRVGPYCHIVVGRVKISVSIYERERAISSTSRFYSYHPDNGWGVSEGDAVASRRSSDSVSRKLIR